MVAAASLPSPNDTLSPDKPYLYPFNSSIGKPVTIMTWKEAFLQASDPTADMLVPRGDWIAPVTSQGQPVGTITADHASAGFVTGGCDDDAQSGAALLAARPKDIVAGDGLNGLFIITDNIARQYGTGNWKVTPQAGTLKQLQEALLAQRKDAAAANNGEPVTGGNGFDFGQWVQQHPETPAPPQAPAQSAPPFSFGPGYLVLGCVLVAAVVIGGVRLAGRRRRALASA